VQASLRAPFSADGMRGIRHGQCRAATCGANHRCDG